MHLYHLTTWCRRATGAGAARPAASVRVRARASGATLWQSSRINTRRKTSHRSAGSRHFPSQIHPSVTLRRLLRSEAGRTIARADVGNDVELIVLDWDGTVVDSIQHIVSSWQSAFGEWAAGGQFRDEAIPSEEAIRQGIGLSVAATIARNVPGATEEDTAQLTEAYRRHFLAGADGTKYFPHAEDGLRQLVGMGLKLAVATGKSRRGLDREMGLLEAEQWFCSSRAADQTQSKPHPQMLQEIMAETGVAPEHTVMIGDSVIDMQLAANAGVRGIAVGYGAEPAAVLLEEAPLHCATDWQDLLLFVTSELNTRATASESS